MSLLQALKEAGKSLNDANDMICDFDKLGIIKKNIISKGSFYKALEGFQVIDTENIVERSLAKFKEEYKRRHSNLKGGVVEYSINYKFFIFETEVKHPIGASELLIKKKRSDFFGGFVYGAYGYIDGFTNLTFNEQVAIDLVRESVNTDKLLAKIPFRAEFCGKEYFKGLIDVGSIEFDGCKSMKCAITDDTDADYLTSRLDVEYAITPTRSILLHAKNLPGTASHTIEKELVFKRISTSPTDCSHYVPLKKNDKGLATVYDTTFAGEHFFILDSQDKELQFQGVLHWTTESVSALEYNLELKVGEEIIILGSYVANTTLSDNKCVIDRKVKLKQSEKAFLSINGGNGTDFNFTYKTDSVIAVKEVESIENSYCYGVTLFEAFGQILSKISDGKISFWSSIIDKDNKDFLTSGENIRGLKKDINISLSTLFDIAKKLYNLKADLQDGEFILSIDDSFGSFLHVGDAYNYTEKVNVKKGYSSVKVGYDTWQSESKFKDDEFNSTRQYTTQVTLDNNNLDITSKAITAGYIIEEVRRLQFDPIKSKEENKFDNNIFLIAMSNDGLRAERNENYYNVSNVIDAGTVYNLRYSPKNILENWSEKLKYSGLIKFESGTGNFKLSKKHKYTGVEYNENENISVVPNLVPYIANFKARLDKELLYTPIDNIEFITNGKLRTGKVLSVEFELDRGGQGWANFEVETVG